MRVSRIIYNFQFIDWGCFILFLLFLFLIAILIGVYYLLFRGFKRFLSSKAAHISSAILCISGIILIYNYNSDSIKETYVRFKQVIIPQEEAPRFNAPGNTKMTRVEARYRNGESLPTIRRSLVETPEFADVDWAITNLKHNSSAQELEAIQKRIDELDTEYGAWCRARLAERIETLRPEHGIATAQQASEERVATDRAHTAARAEIVAIRAKMNNYEQLTPQDLTVIQDNPEAFRHVIGNYNANNPYGIQLDPTTGKVKDSFFDSNPDDTSVKPTDDTSLPEPESINLDTPVPPEKPVESPQAQE